MFVNNFLFFIELLLSCLIEFILASKYSEPEKFLKYLQTVIKKKKKKKWCSGILDNFLMSPKLTVSL